FDAGLSDGGPICPGFPPPPQSGGGITFYVSPAGSDSAPGTEAQPFLTIQQAENLVSPGDTVIVEDGVYSGPPGQNLVLLSRGGAPGNYVWFKARHRWAAKMDGMNNTTTFAWDFNTGV